MSFVFQIDFKSSKNMRRVIIKYIMLFEIFRFIIALSVTFEHESRRLYSNKTSLVKTSAFVHSLQYYTFVAKSSLIRNTIYGYICRHSAILFKCVFTACSSNRDTMGVKSRGPVRSYTYYLV